MSEDFDVIQYWDHRYRTKRGSGPGSRRSAAAAKARFINNLMARYSVQSMIDWGCGDGVVAAKFYVPHYIGLDVSPIALVIAQRNCYQKTEQGYDWSWLYYDGFNAPPICADLALSLDVIFHLIDDDMYRRHMELLFGSAPLVCIHSSNKDEAGHRHVLHRAFYTDVPRDFKLLHSPVTDDIGFWVFAHE